MKKSWFRNHALYRPARVELTRLKTFGRMGSMKNNNKKVGKSSVVFTRLYGRAAYEAWKVREAEIDGLAKSGQYSVRELCRIREDSFRQMKAEGARCAAACPICEKQARLAA